MRWLVVCGLVLLPTGCTDAPAAGGSHGEESDASTAEEGSSQASEEGATEDDGSGSAGPGNADEGEDETETGPQPCEPEGELLELTPEGDYLRQAGTVDGTRVFCTGALHASAGAAASTLRFTYDSDASVEVRVRFEDLLGEVEQDWEELSPGQSVDFTLQRTGEQLLRLEPVDPQAPDFDYTLAAECTTGCALDYTRYPVLFMHGMAGTDAYLSALDYFFGLEDFLGTAGFQVKMGVVDAFAPVETRVVQWRPQFDEMIENGRGRRVNIVAHSQGALDARWMASLDDPDGRIASIVSVGTPHHGTAVADLATGAFEGFNVDPATLNAVVSGLAGIFGLSGAELVEQVEGLTTEAMAEFNDEVLDVEGVYYASWSGHSCRLLDLSCQSQQGGERVDLLFSATLPFLEQAEGPNDGMCSVESGKWGDWQGEIPADHADEIGQIADVNNGAFDHREFYLAELRRLRTLDL